VIGFALLRSRMIPSDACANLGCDTTRGAQAKACLGTREEATVDSEDQHYDRAHARVQDDPENVDRREPGGPSYAGRARNGEEIEGDGRVGAGFRVRFDPR
jgi:hypothetical protein